MSAPLEHAGTLMEGAARVTVISHERPDGDAVGSLLGLSLALMQAGKEVVPVLSGGVPGRYRFLPGSDQVVKETPAETDLVVAVDCAADDRFGLDVGEFPRPPDINIDHHPTNTRYAAANIIDEGAAATTEMLHDLLPAWGYEIDNPVATNLLVGLVTDTIGFRTSSTTAHSLQVAADLVERGAALDEIYERALIRMSFVAAAYWGRGLSRLEHDDGIVWTSLTMEDRRRVGYPGPDDADLVNLLMTIDEARVVVLFVEQPSGKVKVSWRAEPGIDVAEVAEGFGGGGHRPAAGAMIQGDLTEVQEKVLRATRQAAG